MRLPPTLLTLNQNIVIGNIPSIETDNLGRICMGIWRKMVKREDLYNEICGIVNPSDSCMASSMKPKDKICLWLKRFRMSQGIFLRENVF